MSSAAPGRDGFPARPPLSAMAKITRDEAVTALVEVVREALMHGEEASIPELGTFRIEYRPSSAEELPTGEVVMRPPCNEIVFAPHEAP